MRNRLRVIFDVAGLIFNLAAAGFAAAAVYVNQEALTALATTAWGSTDQFKTALLWQSRDMIIAVMLLAFGTALQVAAELVRDQKPDERHASHRSRNHQPAERHPGEHHSTEHPGGAHARESHRATETEHRTRSTRPRGPPRT